MARVVWLTNGQQFIEPLATMTNVCCRKTMTATLNVNGADAYVRDKPYDRHNYSFQFATMISPPARDNIAREQWLARGVFYADVLTNVCNR